MTNTRLPSIRTRAFPVSPFAINKLFDSVFDQFDTWESAVNTLLDVDHTFIPHDIKNVTVDGNVYTHLEFTLAGYVPENIKVEYDSNTRELSLSAVHTNKEDSNCEYIHKGIARRKFQAKYALSESFDESNIESKYQHGILKIVIPHKVTTKSDKPTSIPVVVD